MVSWLVIMMNLWWILQYFEKQVKIMFSAKVAAATATASGCKPGYLLEILKSSQRSLSLSCMCLTSFTNFIIIIEYFNLFLESSGVGSCIPVIRSQPLDRHFTKSWVKESQCTRTRSDSHLWRGYNRLFYSLPSYQERWTRCTSHRQEQVSVTGTMYIILILVAWVLLVCPYCLKCWWRCH